MQLPRLTMERNSDAAQQMDNSDQCLRCVQTERERERLPHGRATTATGRMPLGLGTRLACGTSELEFVGFADARSKADPLEINTIADS